MSIEVKCGDAEEINLRDFIFEKLRSSKRVIVVSPWISLSTARELVTLTKNGVEVSLITANNDEDWHIRGLSELIEVKEDVSIERGKPGLANLGLSVFFSGLLLLGACLVICINSIINKTLTLYLSMALIVAGFLLYFIFRTTKEVYKYSYVPRIKELIVINEKQIGTNKKLHAKLILTDNAVGIGSANFTKYGLSSNIECFAWITDPSIHKQVFNYINTLKKRVQNATIDYESIYHASRFIS
ncbi:MAG: phospholipase D-like domain-containing protein [Desulfurococcaceae archaeon]|nr:phospholipase D-like domain-containing protein [Desulfurococcaceae archaeon]